MLNKMTNSTKASVWPTIVRYGQWVALFVVVTFLLGVLQRQDLLGAFSHFRQGFFQWFVAIGLWLWLAIVFCFFLLLPIIFLMVSAMVDKTKPWPRTILVAIGVVAGGFWILYGFEHSTIMIVLFNIAGIIYACARLKKYWAQARGE